ncbi:hypothetical protein [Bacillus suaedae]|uniref:DUF3139 domain-containing protein n=1 Tax=Halalkalibacter suaedae TaxID=2822140 RepID=A0A941AQD0_9BACI|nr:hypothetical protein [Bacillus suaedae]MBP3952512.1 hypothetical protein [Bacillus suaedae]
MKRKWSLFFWGIVTVLVISFLHVHNNGTLLGKNVAINHSKEYVSEIYNLDRDDIALYGTKFYPGKGHYSIVLQHQISDLYVVDVKLKSFSTEIYYINDVTGSYDKEVLLDSLDR